MMCGARRRWGRGGRMNRPVGLDRSRMRPSMSGLVRVVTGAVVLLVMGLVGHPELALADDAAPPITILEYVPPTVPTWQTFVFRAAVDPVPIDHFECRLDAMPFETCISPWAPVLTAGQHTIAVRAVDVNGLADPTPEEATFAVRDKGPEVTVSINDGAAATGRYLGSPCDHRPGALGGHPGPRREQRGRGRRRHARDRLDRPAPIVDQRRHGLAAGPGGCRRQRHPRRAPGVRAGRGRLR